MLTGNVIEVVFGSTGRTKVLRSLAKAPRPLSGRQVAELSGLTHRGAIQALSTLKDAGVVTQRQVGRAYQYELAKENVVVDRIVLKALESEAGLLDEVKQELIQAFGAHAVSVVLFGSLARGDHTAGSDVDVLAVVKTGEAAEAVDELVDSHTPRFRAKFGAPLSVHVLTVSSLRKRPQSAFLEGVLREGVLLSGKSVEELAGRGA